jgi:Protein of unknown function (DUF5672)
MNPSLVIVIPVYKATLNLLEQFSLDYLLTKVINRKLIFVAPEGLDTNYYLLRYPNITFEQFDSGYFASIAGYNELLLNADFYSRFLTYDYILIHQTDALLFKDNLDDWMGQGYDYIGAPWPLGMTLNFGPDDAAFFGATTLHSFVGNGGFSLRHIQKSIAILGEAQKLLTFWRTHRLNEDCFFAFAGLLHPTFSIPTPTVASRFALELEPEQYVAANQGDIPTGCHAWWKHDFPFWQKVIGIVK